MSFGKQGREKYLSLALAVLLLTSAAGTAWAGELEDQLSELQRQAGEQQEITNRAAAKVESVSEQMRQIQEELRAASAAFSAFSLSRASFSAFWIASSSSSSACLFFFAKSSIEEMSFWELNSWTSSKPTIWPFELCL